MGRPAREEDTEDTQPALLPSLTHAGAAGVNHRQSPQPLTVVDGKHTGLAWLSIPDSLDAFR